MPVQVHIHKSGHEAVLHFEGRPHITIHDAFDPSKHPRGGNPDNPGQFSETGGGGAEAAGPGKGKPSWFEIDELLAKVEKLKVAELKALAKAMGLKKYSKLKSDSLKGEILTQYEYGGYKFDLGGYLKGKEAEKKLSVGAAEQQKIEASILGIPSYYLKKGKFEANAKLIAKTKEGAIAQLKQVGVDVPAEATAKELAAIYATEASKWSEVAKEYGYDAKYYGPGELKGKVDEKIKLLDAAQKAGIAADKADDTYTLKKAIYDKGAVNAIKTLGFTKGELKEIIKRLSPFATPDLTASVEGLIKQIIKKIPDDHEIAKLVKGVSAAKSAIDLHKVKQKAWKKLSGSGSGSYINEKGEIVQWKGEWHAGIATAQHKKAVTNYAGSQYKEINNYLRGGAETVTATANALKTIKYLDQSIGNAVYKGKGPLWRGVSKRVAGIMGETGRLTPGTIISDDGYASFSKSESFASTWKSGLVIEASNVAGPGVADISKLSHHKHEQEVLFARGKKMRVTKYDAALKPPRLYVELLHDQPHIKAGDAAPDRWRKLDELMGRVPMRADLDAFLGEQDFLNSTDAEPMMMVNRWGFDDDFGLAIQW